ncbi:MAG: hypothetical protein ACRDLM_10755 [Gaiellaceae bacterium]
MFAIAVALISLVGGLSAASAVPRCSRQAHAGQRIPAAVKVVTGCATYMISRSGHVFVAATSRPIGQGVSWTLLAGAGAPVVQRGSHIAVFAHGRVVWHSRRRFRASGVFALVGPRSIAFTYERFTKKGEQHSLYVAPLKGSEQHVSVNEQLLGWTAEGELLTDRFEHGVYLRDPTGRLVRRVSGRLREVQFSQASRTLLAISQQGVLERYRGRRWSPIANLPTLGLDRHTTFEQLAGGLIGLLDGHRLALLHQNGSLFASAHFDSGDVAGESGLVANTTGTGVAFVVSHGTAAQPRGSESVELLRQNDRRARTLYKSAVPGRLCVRWATLAWRRDWLLYSVTSGKTFLLESHGVRRLDLTTVVHEIAPTNPRSIGWG